MFLRRATQWRLSCVRASLPVLIAAVLCALPLANVQVQEKRPRPHKSDDSSSSVEILSSTEGADFSAFLNHLMRVVKRNWYAMMPESAMLGEKGKVVLRLQVQQDGTLVAQTPTVEISSGRKPLDRGAIAAIKSSAPFEHLPESFRGPSVELRITFLYNTNVSPTTINS